MADEDNKKPKIDLRARLGKKTVGSNGPSIPPPMATGGSIPAPPFASKPPPAEPEPVKVHKPQAIKIEMSEEVMAAQKKGKAKIIAMAAGTALIGIVLGFAVGSGSAKSERHNIALQGAASLTEDIDKANAEIDKLADILGAAKRSLSDGEYPEKQVKELLDVSIPFDGKRLVGKGTGLMSMKINNDLISYAGRSQEANEQKDRLQRLLAGQEKAISEILLQAEKPKVNWTIFVQNGAHGPMASMLGLPPDQKFLVTSKEKKKDKDGKEVAYSYPEEIEIPAAKDKKEKLKLYKDGNPVSRAPLLIPVDPKSQAGVCPSDTMYKLRSEIEKLETLLKGDRSDPQNEKPGLNDLGKGLIDQLKGIGVGG